METKITFQVLEWWLRKEREDSGMAVYTCYHNTQKLEAREPELKANLS